ncbi:MAG: prepilin-type N-terminal cleavage/methylation domain-containing protein, partial [Anaerolineae bacterium]
MRRAKNVKRNESQPTGFVLRFTFYEQGFTLIELLVILAIASLVTGTLVAI